MPRTTKAVAIPGQADADADAAVGGHALEDDVENRKVERVAEELGCFDEGDEEDGQGEPPEVVGELGAELVEEEVGAGPGCYFAAGG